MPPNKLTLWFLKLKSGPLFLLLLLFPPTVCLWIYFIGVFTSTRLERKNSLFKIVTVISTVMYIGMPVIILIKSIQYHTLIDSRPSGYFVSLLMTSVIISYLLVCKYMVEYEHQYLKDAEDKRLKRRDYIIRFVQLLYFPITIFWIQEIVNQYENTDEAIQIPEYKKPKSKEVAKELVNFLEGFRCHNSLIYKFPIGDILVGFSIDRANHYYINEFVMPLYVPSDHVYYNYGARLTTAEGYESPDFSTEEKTHESINEMGVIMSKEREKIVLLEDYQLFIDFCNTTNYEKTIYELQAIAYTMCFIKVEKAKQLIEDLNFKLKNEPNLAIYHNDILMENDDLLSAIENGTHLKKLEEFKNHTLTQIGL